MAVNKNLDGMKIAHIGIAVNDLKEALTTYEKMFDFRPDCIEEIATQHVRVAFIHVGGCVIELLEPIGTSGAVFQFLKRRGEGLHHLALDVPDLTNRLEKLKAMDIHVIGGKSMKGAKEKEIAFLHPGVAHGVLFELCQSNL
ncbi:VOC family protein [Pontibacillus halophilus]|uniref:VOC family protein n=1 Tax=Pontibacillus halophilus TaxID=516704 RepID=UPI000429649B|nr:VOC family protein [Pontibacillus halophilus]